jgi:3-oxoacyl-[acyl-carrier-protein] synthase III
MNSKLEKKIMTDPLRSRKPIARIAGTGKAVPTTVLSNSDLEQIVDTNDDWIVSRTGIKERHIAQRGERTSEYCIKAARTALEDAHVTAAELDFIIIGTISPDMRFPATAIFVQEALGADNATAWDISATCSGFLYSLYQAEALIALGRAKKGLVIGAEMLSMITDWTDRSTCILFGDGAGAAVITEATDERGILSTYIGSGGHAADLLYCVGHGTAGSLSTGKELEGQQLLHMEGNKVFPHAVRTMMKSANEAMARAGVTADQLDWLVPHQANTRIISATAERMGVPKERVLVTIHKYGNNSSASIPFALDEGRREGMIQDGHTVLCVAFGGGFTWGGSVIRF